MRRVLLILAPIAVVGACASNGDQGMVVLNNTTVQTGTTCLLTGLSGQAFVSQGTISTVSPQGYLATPLILSRITAMPGQEAQKTIYLQGAVVQLSVPAGSQPITLDSTEQKFLAPFSGALAPEGTINIGFELVPLSVIQKVAALGGTHTHVEITAKATVYGTLANDTINAEPWSYPVTICNDCVVNPIGVCPQAAVHTGNPCNVFQDGLVDCCTSSTGGLICPSSSM